ncbi:hypothetical protein ACJRO7_033048 [Eucalyptus globulus]|uniref:Wall-associated receptor kinase galacturonan-binding domain-containing protein n=1 Tax=Eucalyptus globulus TaxID=34317 RepID=A0ABD3JQ35_EUCGL
MELVLFLLLVSVAQVSSLTPCPKCGSMEVPYPLSTDDSCGDPRYKVYCKNGGLEFLSAGGTYYEVLSIDPSADKLVISPPMIQNNTCYSSDLSVGGLSLDEKLPFNISTHNTVILLNCSDSLQLSPLNCSSNSFCRAYENNAVEARGCRNTLCCHYLKDSAMTSHRIRIRVEGCTAYTSVVNIKPDDPVGSWNYGIELQWVRPS